MKYINSVPFLKGGNGYPFTLYPYHKVILIQLQLDLFSEDIYGLSEFLDHPDQPHILCASLSHSYLGYDPAVWGMGNPLSPEANIAFGNSVQKFFLI